MTHIYFELLQPATRWRCGHCDPPTVIEWPRNRLLWVQCCGKRRPAKNCVLQSYYDGPYVWCADGKGCKSPKLLAAKRRREFRNRSAGQKARWQKTTGGTS